MKHFFYLLIGIVLLASCQDINEIVLDDFAQMQLKYIEESRNQLSYTMNEIAMQKQIFPKENSRLWTISSDLRKQTSPFYSQCEQIVSNPNLTRIDIDSLQEQFDSIQEYIQSAYGSYLKIEDLSIEQKLKSLELDNSSFNKVIELYHDLTLLETKYQRKLLVLMYYGQGGVNKIEELQFDCKDIVCSKEIVIDLMSVPQPHFPSNHLTKVSEVKLNGKRIEKEITITSPRFHARLHIDSLEKGSYELEGYHKIQFSQDDVYDFPFTHNFEIK